MSDDSIAVLCEEKHLACPRLRRQRPAVAEDNRLAGAPILVVDLSAVLGCDSGHFSASFFDKCTTRNARGCPIELRSFAPSTISVETKQLAAILGRNTRMDPDAIS